MQSPDARPFPFRIAIACLALLLLSPVVLAQSNAGDATLPDWDRLSPQQHELLIAPVRERWNARPERRARMLEHATRWREMSPEQHRNARHGIQRWRHMPPGQREEMRALYGKMRTLSRDERHALRNRWKAMTPEQRHAWVQANPPPERRRDR